MKTEKDIEMLCGKNRPFIVPEGYFESLTARVMSNLPETGKVVQLPKRHYYWKEWTTAAAACIAAVVIFTHYTDKTPETKITAATTTVYDEQYQEDMMEYAMMDHNDVYNYLSGEGY